MQLYTKERYVDERQTIHLVSIEKSTTTLFTSEEDQFAPRHNNEVSAYPNTMKHNESNQLDIDFSQKDFPVNSFSAKWQLRGKISGKLVSVFLDFRPQKISLKHIKCQK